MKKRVFALCLSVILILSALMLTSCERVTAYALVSGAMKKTQALDSMDADVTMKMSVDVMGISTEVPMTFHVKAAGLKTDKPIMAADMTMSMMGFDMTTNLYSEGEYFYVTSMGENMKMKIGELTEDYDVMGDIADTVKELPEDLLKDVEAVNNDDGTKTVSVTIPDDAFASIYKELLESTGESAAGGSEITDVAVSNAKADITVSKEGYIAVYKLAFDMSMTVDGEQATSKMDMTVNYKNPGTAVTVTAPEGYQDFEELTEDDLYWGDDESLDDLLGEGIEE
jgi:hypothetical protein